MDTMRLAAVALAALELVPGDPCDLTDLLRQPTERAALLEEDNADFSRPLTGYLQSNLDLGRVDHWLKQIERLARNEGVQPLVAGQAGYPTALLECWDAPPVLFCRGQFPVGPTLAIVGSREASVEAVDHTMKVSAEAARSGLVVVSGLAAGIDTAAHRGTLDGCGQTIAVMGTGIERIYPRQNEGLAEEIATSGCLLSQFTPDAPRTGTTFLLRNRVIAGLAGTSLIMEARERSGSRHEMEQALGYGRTILLWEPTMNREKWAHDLVTQGVATFVSSPDDVVRQTLRDR
jgi:DNA processing protein